MKYIDILLEITKNQINFLKEFTRLHKSISKSQINKDNTKLSNGNNGDCDCKRNRSESLQ